MASNSSNQTFTNFFNFTSQCYLDYLCLISARVLRTPGLGALLIIELIIGSVAIILNLLLFAAVWKVSLFHWNLRLLLAHLAFCSVVFCSANLYKAAVLARGLFESDPCSLIILAYDCKIRDLPGGWMSQSLLYTCASITVERLYCTVRYKKPYQGFPILGIVLCLACHTVPLQSTVRTWVYVPGHVAICDGLWSMSSESAKVNLSINLFFTLLSVCLVCVLHQVNRHHSQSTLVNRALTLSLSSRFLLEQNFQLTKVIWPSTILVFITFLPNQIFLTCFMLGFQMSTETKLILLHCNYAWKCVFCLLYPLIAFWKNAHLRRGLIRLMPVVIRTRWFGADGKAKNGTQQRTAVVTITTKGLTAVNPASSHVKTHFEVLDKIWVKKK